ncbi:hypothetical protein ACSBLW_15580 [Thioclava sp. FR2]|uniref:hypothetical protein n=1 Tax=Thioclava sp. FR2 TaxID=3445780 RepID=UPI003EB92EAE
MLMTSNSPFRSVFAAVFPFHATPEVVATMVPANVDRRRERVTREEMQALFAADLKTDLN